MTPLRSASRCLFPLGLVALLLALAGVALADAAADRIRATPGGGSSEWDAKVRLILLANYDLDGSGAIDKVPEVQAIPCGTWGALDEGVRAGWGQAIRQIYGFEAGYGWIGNAIGFAEAVRVQADQALAGCEAAGFQEGAASASVADRIRALGVQGGSDAWDAAVKPLLVDAYDADKSGSVDRTEEVLAIPCDVWKALDDGVRQKWPAGLRQTYGLKAGLSWVGFTLGFSDAIRSGVDLRAASCLEAQATTPPPSATPAPAPTSGAVHDRIRATPGGGSSSWDAQVHAILVGAYDADGSGWLDTGAEAREVTCEDWKALDDGVKAGWGYSIRTIYGFHPDYAWVGDAVGFSETVRTIADGRFVECIGGDPTGQVVTPPTLTDPGQLITSFPNGGTSEWDEQVKQVMVAFYDADGSGLLDSEAELQKITCEVWKAIDAGVRQRFPYGVRPVYGFPGGDYVWNANVIGFDVKIREAADGALVACGIDE